LEEWGRSSTERAAISPSAPADLRRLRRRCERRLQDLELSSPFRLEEFVARVAEHRGRPIVVQAVKELGDGAVGCWIAIERPPTDLILCTEATTPMHAEHIVLHELSHLLCGHRPQVVGEDVASRLFPDLSPEVVAGALNRSAYSSRDEMEAEMMATLIRLRAAQPSSTERPTENDVVRRLEAFAKGEPPA